jgi:hypothetical protein
MLATAVSLLGLAAAFGDVCNGGSGLESGGIAAPVDGIHFVQISAGVSHSLGLTTGHRVCVGVEQ